MATDTQIHDGDRIFVFYLMRAIGAVADESGRLMSSSDIFEAQTSAAITHRRIFRALVVLNKMGVLAVEGDHTYLKPTTRVALAGGVVADCY